MALTVTTENAAALNAWLARLQGTDGNSARSKNLHIVGIGDSYTAGWGASAPTRDAWFERLVAYLKYVGGDGGRYQPIYQRRVLWDYERRNVSDGDVAAPTANGTGEGYRGEREYYTSICDVGTPYGPYFIASADQSGMPGWGIPGNTSGFGGQYGSIANPSLTQLDTAAGQTIAAFSGSPVYYRNQVDDGHIYIARSITGTGVTTGAKPTFDKGYGKLTTWVSTNGATFQEAGYYPNRIKLPPFRFLDIVGQAGSSASAQVTINAVETVAGFPYTLDAGTGVFPTQQYSKILATLDTGVLSAKTLTVKYAAGTTYLDGFVCRRNSGTGVIGYNLGYPGRKISDISASMITNGFLGENFLPADGTVMFVIMLGVNDYRTSVSQSTANAALTTLIQGIQARYGANAPILYVVPPPFDAAGAPSVSDAQYVYMNALGKVASSLGACTVYLQSIFGISAAAAVTAGFFINDSLHPSSYGHGVLAEGVMQGIGYATDSLQYTSDFNVTQKASIQAAAVTAVQSVLGVNADGSLVSNGLADHADDAYRKAVHYTLDDTDKPQTLTLLKDDGTTKKTVPITTTGSSGVKVGS